MKLLRKLLELPEASGLDLEDPANTELRREILRKKAFLVRLYSEWYGYFKAAAGQAPSGLHVELGSGPGFLEEFISGLIRTDVLRVRFIDAVLSAQAMPFKDASVSGIYMTNVFHHIARPRDFFSEARRCLKPGGRVAMVDTYNSCLGRYIYTNYHYEGFDPAAKWELEEDSPHYDANNAVSWIVFERDRAIFEEEFPELKIVAFKPIQWLSYLISGGIPLRPLMPGFAYPACRAFEKLLSPMNRHLSLLVYVELERV